MAEDTKTVGTRDYIKSNNREIDKSNSKRILRKGVLGFLALFSALCCASTVLATAPPAGERTGVTNNQILIGSCCALSGPAKELGVQQLYGAKAYLNYINDKGGVNGRKIKLKEYDDKYEVATAIECFNQLVNDKCFAAAFLVGTPTGAKHVAMAETKDVPLVGIFSGAQILREPHHPHVFHVRASYNEETAAQIDHLFKDCGPKRVGIIYQDDAFGASVLNGYKTAMAKYGATPVALGSFKRNSVDVQSAIDDVRAGKPDFVGLAGQYTSEAAILQKSHAQGWRPLFGTVSFVGTEALIAAGKKDAEGTVITQVVPLYEGEQLPTVSLYKKLLKKYFPDAKPDFSSFEGFVDAIVLVKGLERAGTDLTRTKFIQALESIHNEDLGMGPEFKLTYGPLRHTGFDTVYFTQVKNGHAVTFTDWKDVLPKH
jgi:branched-chain amino acid transport system substrate-binding protein